MLLLFYTESVRVEASKSLLTKSACTVAMHKGAT
jgi:hypothetical protein